MTKLMKSQKIDALEGKVLAFATLTGFLYGLVTMPFPGVRLFVTKEEDLFTFVFHLVLTTGISFLLALFVNNNIWIRQTATPVAVIVSRSTRKHFQ